MKYLNNPIVNRYKSYITSFGTKVFAFTQTFLVVIMVFIGHVCSDHWDFWTDPQFPLLGNNPQLVLSISNI